MSSKDKKVIMKSLKKILLVVLISLVSISSFAKGIKISDEGKDFIKKQESCVLHAYWDSNGYSIGYGHHARGVHKGMTITFAQALKYFNEDITTIESSVSDLLDKLPYKYNFSQGFIDGFISFTYNVGPGGAQKSIFYKRLKNCRVVKGVMNEEDLAYALAGIKISGIKCSQHKKRRQEEYNLMTK